MLIPLSASHAHSLANLRKTPDEVVAELGRMRAARDASGSRMLIEAGISTAFGCTLQGEVKPAEVVRLVQAALDAGADRVSLADTVGYANPAQVENLFTDVLRVAGDRLTCAHFHDTRGLGMANALAVLRLGITRFDACLAGIGGCPHAPGASGNVSTEDLAFMLESMGIDTGCDLEALLAPRPGGRMAGRRSTSRHALESRPALHLSRRAARRSRLSGILSRHQLSPPSRHDNRIY
jgi:hydroxymethylglutaryl-CoA lyase